MLKEECELLNLVPAAEPTEPALTAARVILSQAQSAEQRAAAALQAIADRSNRLAAVIVGEQTAAEVLAQARGADARVLGDWLADPGDRPRPGKSAETIAAEEALRSAAIDAEASRATQPGIQAQLEAAVGQVRQAAENKLRAAGAVIVDEFAAGLLHDFGRAIEQMLTVEARLRGLVTALRAEPLLMGPAAEIEEQIRLARAEVSVQRADEWAQRQWSAVCADAEHRLED